jgi:hypothetical protein|tara:strand:- start:130 stop:333 length:204 start_codon:yes stop_codon:yes gene_type:complete
MLKKWFTYYHAHDAKFPSLKQNCNYAFAWGTTKSSGLTLADLRGSNIPAPAVETVRSGYVRTVSDCE